MDAPGYLTFLVNGIPAAVRRRIDDLSEDQLRWRTTPRSNHVGFILWHALRACDMQLGRVRGVTSDDEVWQTEGFRQRTGYDPRGLGLRGIGIGTGFSTAMVDQVPVSKDLVGGYADAVAQAMATHLATISGDDLDRAVANSLTPGMTVAQVFEVAIRQMYQHLGECDYVRGLIGIPDPTMPAEE